MNKTASIPRNEQQLAVDHEVRFAMEETPEGQKARFSILFATGKPIPNHWGWPNLTIDLDSVKFAAKKMPVLLSHSRRVGFTTKVERREEGFVAEGEFLTNDDAKAIREDAAQGFPFQASCWLQPGRIEEVREGVSVQVNGFALKGPAWIWRECLCREVTVTELGADKNTKVEALSQGQEPLSVSIFTSEEGKQMKITQDGPKTVEQLSELHPDLVKAVREQSFAEGLKQAKAEFTGSAQEETKRAVEAERNRCGRILKRATGGQIAMAAKFVADGTDLDTATDKLLEDPLRNAQGKKEELAASAPPAIPPAKASTSAAGSAAERAEKFGKEFDESQELQANWGTRELYIMGREFAHQGKLKEVIK